MASAALPKLDHEQQVAVITPPNEKMAIIAGAGSGKTSVLTSRAAWLRLTSPNREGTNLCLSYTNKAADEISDRLRRIMDEPGVRARFSSIEKKYPAIRRNFWAGTLHSFAKTMIEEITRPSIWKSLPQGDRDELVSISDLYQVFANNNGRIPKILSEIQADELWGRVVSEDRYLGRSFLYDWKRKKADICGIWTSRSAATIMEQSVPDPIDHPDSVAFLESRVWQPFDITVLENHASCLYQATKQDQRAVDYDDLLLMAIGGLRFVPNLREHYRSALAHILIDEAQDITYLDYTFLSNLPGFLDNEEGSPGYTIVGDARQEIYDFRSGESSLFVKLLKSGWPSKTVRLNTNYRCAKKIVSLAAAVAQNPWLYMDYEPTPDTRALTPEWSTDGKVSWMSVHKDDPAEEYMEKAIRESLADESIRTRVFLVRSNWMKPYIMDCLDALKIPKNKFDISTVHSAKGREWDHVMLCFMGRAFFPARPRFWNTPAENLQSESRLLYVAITRAAKRIDIFETYNGIFQSAIRAVSPLDEICMVS